MLIGCFPPVNPNPPDDALWVRPIIHPCQKDYQNIVDSDMHDDFCDLLNMVQHHTHCSTCYCLRKNRYAMRTCICKAKCERGKSYINMVNGRLASETVKKAEQI